MIKNHSHRTERASRIKHSKRRLEQRREDYRRRSNSFLRSPIWKQLRRRTLEVYGHRCMCCGATFTKDNWIEVDHIHPRSTHHQLRLMFSNLQVLCRACNLNKGAQIIDYRPDPLPAEAYRMILLQMSYGLKAMLATPVRQEFNMLRSKQNPCQNTTAEVK